MSVQYSKFSYKHTRVVRKIRFPWRYSPEKRCYGGSRDSVVYLGSPTSNTLPSELPAELSLGLAAVRDGSPPRFVRQL